MLVDSVTLEDTQPGEVRLSPDGSRIYSSGSDGYLRVYDARTGDLIDEWQVGQNLGGIDISPDGSFLMIVDRGLSFVYRVDAESGDVTRFSYTAGSNEGLMFDVVVLSDGTALFTQDFNGSGWTQLQILDLATGDFTDVASVRQSSTLVRDATGERVFVTEPNSSGGPINMFETGTGIVAQGGRGGFNRGVQAYNGEMAANYIYNVGITVYDNSLNQIVTLTSWNNGAVRDLAWSPDGDFLYILDQDANTIVKVSTETWLVAETIDTGIDVGTYDGRWSNGARLLVDPSERYFTVVTNGSFVIVENPSAPEIIGTNGDDVLLGALFEDILSGGLGNDTIDGGSNIDTAIVSGNRSSYTITQTSTGVFQVTAGAGIDTLTNIEFLQFDDTTIRLLNGTGVTVNFETADPSVYQAAMNNIRDFDGNNVGGQGGWLRIGSADVNGDGDVDQILVNDTNGRFATVGTADDGLVYFDDHSWAGETRVAGIYIDPLVTSGQVEAGGDSDSQRRFQNDLEIENINRVLGADDYDGDGLQEVYFALTDGSAYLHAYMHADGNIQYANYQSQQEVIDFLTANGFGPETYADWFPDAEGAAEESADKNVPEQIQAHSNDPWASGYVAPTDTELVQFQLAEVFA